MAKQHFYARVPARMSLFQKMDGYDTFAHSEGVEREFIENELSSIYDNKLNKEESVLALNNALPPVYCQFTAKDGTVVQGTVSYSESDYTGERSAYMTHALLLSDADKKAVLDSLTATPFDKSVFKTDLSDFDLTAQTGKPITDLPELTLRPQPYDGAEWLAQKHDAGMLKRLIYALIGAACGKIKAVYLSLPSDLSTFSEDNLEFINAILTIFPYHMRTELSFITYIPDAGKSSVFKIRCISESAPAIPIAKGVSVKMGIKDCAGIRDEVVAANAAVVDFFYRMLTDDEMRCRFIEFCDHAVTASPVLQKPTLKSLTDLVFMFCALGGFYDANAIIPNDDAVYNYICVYEKNREALPEDYRVRALDCLKRYPETKTAIPKNVFAKMTAMYATEPKECRRTVMAVVSDLIHTDVMREKLFAFIKSTYDTEDAEMRAVIMQDLCRVYYGGFLQSPVLSFFAEYFAKEPETIRAAILEKLLLTIRTPKIQGEVLEFIRQFYPTFSDAEKELFYHTYAEMLPEADALSRALSDIVDEFIEEDRKPAIAETILSALEADEKRHNPHLCETLAVRDGFTEQVIAGKVFGEWSERKVFTTFAEAIARREWAQKAAAITEIFRAAPAMKASAQARLFEALKNDTSVDARTSVFYLIDAADALDAAKSEMPAVAPFIEQVKTEILYPQTAKLIPTAFDFKRYPDGVRQLAELAKDRAYLRECEQYACVKQYEDAVETIQSGNAAAAFVALADVEERPLRLGMAEGLRRDLAALTLSDEQRVLIALLREYLKSGEYKFADVAGAMRDEFARAVRSQNAKADAETVGWLADEQAFSCMVTAGARLYEAMADEQKKQDLIASSGNLCRYIVSFLNKYEKKGRRSLTTLAQMLTAPAEYTDAVRGTLNVKTASGRLFKRLFKK